MVPKKITPCPIVDCVIELRFRTSVETAAIFGIMYQAFKETYPNVDKLPILNLPEQIRDQDPNLIYQPWYRLRNGGFNVSIGSRAVGIGKVGEYPGWASVSERFRNFAHTVSSVGVIDQVERVALRYINFFNFDIFHKAKLVIKLGDAAINSEDTLIRAVLPGLKGRFKSLLHVSNHAAVNAGGSAMNGSVIDIDTSLETNLDDFFPNATQIIEEGHDEEKEVFFSLLDDAFLADLNPEY